MKILTRSFDCRCNFEQCFEILFRPLSFFHQFHEQRGDVDINLMEWIDSEDKQTGQRLFCYSMVEKDGGDQTKCLETQKYHIYSQERMILIESLVKPDSAVGNIFSIHFSYKMKPGAIADNTSKIEIEAKIECLKKIWGFQGMVEGIIEKQVNSSLDLWTSMATSELNKNFHKVSSDDNDHFEQQSTSSSNFTPIHVNSPHLRFSTMKRVVNGTESLVRFLSVNRDLADRTLRQAEEGIEDAFGESSHLKGNSRRSEECHCCFVCHCRRRTVWRIVCCLLLAIVMISVYWHRQTLLDVFKSTTKSMNRRNKIHFKV